MAFYSLQNQRQVNKALFVQANWHIKIEKQKNGMVPSHEQTRYYNNASLQQYNHKISTRLL
jgi:hypothetical protein